MPPKKTSLPVIQYGSDANYAPEAQSQMKGTPCRGCELQNKPRLCGTGAGGKVDIMLVSESPSQWSVNNGEVFFGRGGRVIRSAWRSILAMDAKNNHALNLRGLKKFETYAVQCQVEDGREQETASKAVIQRCKGYLQGAVAHKQPKVILAFGATAMKALDYHGGSFTEARGRTIDMTVAGHQVKVIPTFSTRHIQAKSGLYNLFYADFLRAVRLASGVDDAQDTMPIEELTKNYRLPMTLDEVEKLCDDIISYTIPGKAASASVLAVDTETNTINPHRKDAKLLCVSFAWDTGLSGSIPLEHPQSPWTPEELEIVQGHVRRVLECQKPKSLHHGKFDLKMLELRYGWRVNNVAWDTMLGEHLLREDMSGNYGLKTLGRSYFPAFGTYADKIHELAEKLTPDEEGLAATLANVKKGKIPDDVEGVEEGLRCDMSRAELEKYMYGSNKRKKSFDGGYERVPLDTLLTYAAVDTDLTRRLMRHQFARMQSEKYMAARTLMSSACVPGMRVLGKMEFDGMRVDKNYLEQSEMALAQVVKDKEEELARHWDKPTAFNPNSTHDVGYVLYQSGVLVNGGRQGRNDGPWVERGKTGRLKTDKKTLKAIAEKRDCPFARSLLEYRAAHKALTGFLTEIKALSEYDGYLHTNFHQHGTSTGRLSSSSINCFDGHTEILTPEGWIKFSELDSTTPVAQWHEDGHIDFVRPTAHIKRRHIGYMISLKNEHIDMCLTEDHRCLVVGANGKNKVVEASNYPISNHKQLHAGMFVGGQGLDLTDDELRIVVATQADGSWAGNRIEFGFSKKRKIDRLNQLIQSTEANFHTTSLNNKTRIWISGNIRDKVYSILGDSKTYGPWLMRATRHQLNVIIDEIMFWDGCWKRKTMYSSSEEINVDWIQIVHVLSNLRANTRSYRNNTKGARLNFQVDATRRNYSWTTNIHKTLIPYDDMVYCVSVPSSYVLIRRNGKTAITGQCQNLPSYLSGVNIKRIFVPDADDEVIFNVDWKAAEIRVFTAYAPDDALIKALNDGLDVHSWFTQEIFGIPYDEVEAKKDTDKTVKDTRITVKRVVFGTLYGAMAKKIAETAGISQERAQEIIDKLYARFPSLADYMDEVVAQIRKVGYVETLFGRRRRFPLHDVNGFFRGQAERRGKNMKIQSTSSDIVMGQLVEIGEHIHELGGRLCITVHDSIVGTIKKKYLHQAEGFFDHYCVQRVREKYPWLPVDFAHDVSVGPTYGDTVALADYMKSMQPATPSVDEEFDMNMDLESMNELREDEDEALSLTDLRSGVTN